MKRKVSFAEQNDYHEISAEEEIEEEENLETFKNKRKPVLEDDDESDDESDEAEDEEKILINEHIFEGQEKQSIGTDEWYSEVTEDGERRNVRIIPFNVEEDLQDGDFDSEGMYLERKDPSSIHDSWLKGLQEKDIRMAAASHERREKKIASGEEKSKRRNKSDLLLLLFDKMLPNEQVVDCIRRVGRTKDKGKNRNLKDVEVITGIVDDLMALGELNIYQESFENIRSELISTGLIDRRKNNATAVPSHWEYCWDHGGEIYGPFSADDMVSWNNAGYFKDRTLWIRPNCNSDFFLFSGKNNDFL
jgi:CD2 antigen cytoplasmic tail-binding protein 2